MDKQKIDEIYRENAAMVYRYLSGLTQDSGLAEELTQETFFQAVRGIDNFRGDCKISVWLCGIAKNLWYKELEKRKRHRTVELDDTIPSPESVENKSLIRLKQTENWARHAQFLSGVDRQRKYCLLFYDLFLLRFSDFHTADGRNAEHRYRNGRKRKFPRIYDVVLCRNRGDSFSGISAVAVSLRGRQKQNALTALINYTTASMRWGDAVFEPAALRRTAAKYLLSGIYMSVVTLGITALCVCTRSTGKTICFAVVYLLSDALIYDSGIPVLQKIWVGYYPNLHLFTYEYQQIPLWAVGWGIFVMALYGLLFYRTSLCQTQNMAF